MLKIQKKEILINVKPSLMTFIRKSGHTGTNIRLTNTGLVMDFDGKKTALTMVRAFIRARYTFKHMHTGEVFEV